MFSQIYGQNTAIQIEATLNTEQKTVAIAQVITYQNTSAQNLSEIYLNDWANSFSSKTTPLGKRFSEDFRKRFYYAKESERGSTTINQITDSNGNALKWSRPEAHPDILKVELPTNLNSGASYTLKLNYLIKIPDDKFTRYGYHNNGDFSLRYWYIAPAVFNKTWQIYSNKNLDDLYSDISDFQINFTFPNTYNLITDLDKSEIKNDTLSNNNLKKVQLLGKDQNEINLYLRSEDTFYEYQSNGVKLVSDIEDNELQLDMKIIATTRIVKFLEKKLGTYPFEKILVSNIDYKTNPVYGLNQLPDFLRPFPDGFQYEIKQLKIITETFLDKTIFVNPRYDSWIKDGMHIYLMMLYTEQYYPDIKLVGNLSKIIGLRWFHAADLEFNDQYFLAYKNIARLFLDQPLDVPRDKLVKFNANIANTYKAGIGFKYLEDYLEDDNIINKSLTDFFNTHALKHTSSQYFRTILTTNSSKDVSWFFDEFVSSKEHIDFRIKSVKKSKDSLEIVIKNINNINVPISLSGLRKGGGLVSKTWINNIKGTKKITIAREDIRKLVLDKDQKIPEINRRNNYRNIKGLLNKPLQFRILEDLEDPRYSQVFFIPEFDFNVYDGLSIGTKFYNKTIIRRPLNYKITPFYGLKSRKLLGSASIFYRHQMAHHGLYQIRFGMSGSTFSYAPDLLFKRISPNINFLYRPKDLRSNEKQSLSFRYISLQRERNEINPISTTDYDVFNARYIYSDFNLIDAKWYNVNYELSKNFSKLSTTINYRKTFLNNRQINFRLFAGAFLFNDTQKDGDFFSFALDRPTDYLFDYNYLGRSEDAGLVSQQIIIAEGGFKSQLEVPFANQWITTLGANTNIWNWIYLYGDVGLVKNQNISPKFVYDSGIRLSLVADYFELFFPIYSNKGWEIAQPDYDKQIRFIITLSPTTLIKLFTREWY